MVDFQHAAVFGVLLQQIAVFAHIDGGGGHDLFAQRVDGRVGDLGEHLPEIAKQRLVLVREHGQRRVRAHRADGLRAVQGHRQDRIPVFLIGIAEGALQTRALGAGQRGDLLVGHLHIAQAQKVLVQPFAVRALRGVALAHGVVVQQFAFGQIGQQHLARVQAAFAQDPALVQLQHAGLGRQDQPPIVGHAVARRAQAVAVQRRAQHVAVAEQKGRRAVPRFHHGGVVLVKIPPLAA